MPDPAPETVSEPVTATPDPLAPEPTAPEAAPVTETASPPAKASKPAAKAKVAARQSDHDNSNVRNPFIGRHHGRACHRYDPSDPARRGGDRGAGRASGRSTAAARSGPGGHGLARPGAADGHHARVGRRRPARPASAAGMALRSRRRRKEEERIEEAKWAYIETHPEPEAEVAREPAFVRTPAPMHDPVPATSAALGRRTGHQTAQGLRPVAVRPACAGGLSRTDARQSVAVAQVPVAPGKRFRPAGAAGGEGSRDTPARTGPGQASLGPTPRRHARRRNSSFAAPERTTEPSRHSNTKWASN